MASIDINTSQNVIISYELAKLWERGLAWIIDCFLNGLIALILYFVLAFFFNEESMLSFLPYMVALPFCACYTLIFEFLWDGATPGKYFLRIKVIRIDGRQPIFFDYLLRWVFRLSDIWFSVGSLAAILIGSSERSQRMGDLLSNTVVVRSRSTSVRSLKEILTIKTIQEYQPRYPSVKAIREEDMLLVKHLIERNSRYSNMAHKEAVAMAAERLAFLIGLSAVPGDKVEFLKDCIRDYIVLTR
jgi:uncharacterized RDD family membrane protein YckC